MNNPSHPSEEFLSAYHDGELSSAERETVDQHLGTCTGCREALDGFTLLQGLTAEIEESLPGEAYWKDLPDRILVRIGFEAVPVRPAPTASWWSRLLKPQGNLRLAWGGAAGLVLAVGLWFVLAQQPSPWNEVPREVAEVPTDLPGKGEPLFGNLESIGERPEPPAMNPEAYSRRVILSLSRNNIGTSLDILPGATPGEGQGSSLGSQVSTSLPALGPETADAAREVIAAGCGVNSLDNALLAAMKAEETGNLPLAYEGYRIIQSNLEPESPLRHYAEYRMVYLTWQARLQSNWQERAQAINRLSQIADTAYLNWEASQLYADCQEAWCVNKVLMTLAPEVAAPDQLQRTLARINNLEGCVE